MSRAMKAVKAWAVVNADGDYFMATNGSKSATEGMAQRLLGKPWSELEKLGNRVIPVTITAEELPHE